MIKIHKRKKKSRMKGRSTHGGGARKKRKKSGHRGGAGMSGSGKRADHKKTLITKLYGHGYFGKKGITSKKTQKDKRKRISIKDIETNLERYIKKGIAEKTTKGFEVNLENYKILGPKNKDYEPNIKLIIKAKEASKTAIKKVEKAGGEIILKKEKNGKPAKNI
jgi:large subunit ribosomal protein L15